MTYPEELICHELVELATDYLEGTLDERDRALLEAHLDACTGCTRYIEQLRATIRLTGTIEGATLAPDAETALLSAFRAWKVGS